MLAGMQKAMSDLKTRIVKLEKAQSAIYTSPFSSPSSVPNNGPIAQQSASTSTPKKEFVLPIPLQMKTLISHLFPLTLKHKQLLKNKSLSLLINRSNYSSLMLKCSKSWLRCKNHPVSPHNNFTHYLTYNHD